MPAHVHEDRTIIFIVILQKWNEGAIHAVVPGDLAVAGRKGRDGDAGAGGATGILTAHAVSSTVQAVVGDRPDDQG